MITEEMIQDCIEYPVRSQEHSWRPGMKDQQEYNSLHHRGRSLYDQLRTKYGIGHSEAFEAAFERFGFSRVVMK